MLHANLLLSAWGNRDSLRIGIIRPALRSYRQCDYPFDAQTKRVIVRSVFDSTSPSNCEITSMISERLRQGMGLYVTYEEALRDANPDILLTQAHAMFEPCQFGR